MELVSIGELSKRTGISVLRLRAWESRYGFPIAHVLGSGHRRYEQAMINRTALIAQLLEKGMRVGKVIHLSNEEMTDLLVQRQELSLEGSSTAGSFHEAFQYVIDLDEAGFTKYWQDRADRLSALDLLDQHVYPFLLELGEKWENGIIGVSQEHFASNILEYIIERSWRSKNIHLKGNVSVLALLPNEYHAFGLHFAASLCVSNKQKVLFLGERTPLDAIIEMTQKASAKRVIISVSETYDIKLAEKYLRSLLSKMPQLIEFWVGGAGAPEIEGIVKLRSLKELDQLLGESL
jgi:MerR family transcriptional regulator, light-induced transcriptional regulator